MLRSAWNMRSPEQSIDYFCKAKKFLTRLIGNGLFLSQFYFDPPISFAFSNMSCAALKKTCCAHIHTLSLFSWTCFSRSLFIFLVIESSFVLSVHLILCSKTNCDLFKSKSTTTGSIVKKSSKKYLRRFWIETSLWKVDWHIFSERKCL